jgi:hypothetical protein
MTPKPTANSVRMRERPRTYAKKASARCDELSKNDMKLLASSREIIANTRHRLKKKKENVVSSSCHPVNWGMLQRHLQQAEAHVAMGAEHIWQQRERLSQLEREGHDTFRTRALLAQFEDLQDMHIAHRDRLLQQLK